jgi:hypothetical protein
MYPATNFDFDAQDLIYLPLSSFENMVPFILFSCSPGKTQLEHVMVNGEPLRCESVEQAYYASLRHALSQLSNVITEGPSTTKEKVGEHNAALIMNTLTLEFYWWDDQSENAVCIETRHALASKVLLAVQRASETPA